MKIKPLHPDFEAMPEVDFTGKLNNPVSYDNSFDEIVAGLKNPEVRRNMGDALVNEIFVRAYNYTAAMFAGYNRLSYICMMYAEEVKKSLLRMTLDEEYPRQYLLGIKACTMDGTGPVTIKPPYLVIGADTADKAETTYKSNVPLTDYYGCHIVAYREGSGNWQLLSEIVTRADMQQMLGVAAHK